MTNDKEEIQNVKADFVLFSHCFFTEIDSKLYEVGFISAVHYSVIKFVTTNAIREVKINFVTIKL